MKVKSNQHESAICCHSLSGPSFGGGCDIRIGDNSNTTNVCYSQLGSSYKHPQYAYGTDEVRTFLAGSFKFQLDEIEVFQKE